MSTIGHLTRRKSRTGTVYQVTDRLHAGRAVRVPSDQIAATVSGWLAEPGHPCCCLAAVSRQPVT